MEKFVIATYFAIFFTCISVVDLLFLIPAFLAYLLSFCLYAHKAKPVLFPSSNVSSSNAILRKEWFDFHENNAFEVTKALYRSPNPAACFKIIYYNLKQMIKTPEFIPGSIFEAVFIYGATHPFDSNDKFLEEKFFNLSRFLNDLSHT